MLRISSRASAASRSRSSGVMSVYVCHRAKPMLRSIVVASGDGPSITPRYAGSLLPLPAEDDVASAAPTLGVTSEAAAKISARSVRDAMRRTLAGGGRASIIVDRVIADCADVEFRSVGSVLERRTE